MPFTLLILKKWNNIFLHYWRCVLKHTLQTKLFSLLFSKMGSFFRAVHTVKHSPVHNWQKSHTSPKQQFSGHRYRVMSSHCWKYQDSPLGRNRMLSGVHTPDSSIAWLSQPMTARGLALPQLELLPKQTPQCYFKRVWVNQSQTKCI